MTTLFTVAELRAILDRENTSATTGRLADAVLTEVAERVTALVATYCGRTLLAGAAADKLELIGDGTCYLRLYEQGAYPIVSVSSVIIDGETIPAQPNSNSAGWKLNAVWRRRGIVALVDYTATLDAECSVTATYGYVASSSDRATLVAAGTMTAIEAAEHETAVAQLKHAALDWAVYLVNHYVAGADQIEIGTMAMSFSERQMPARVKAALTRFRSIASG